METASVSPKRKVSALLVVGLILLVLALGFGNRLYSNPDPARRLPQLWEWYYENPRPPVTPAALKAWATSFSPSP